MNRFTLIIAVLFCVASAASAQQLDSVRRAVLDARLTEYVGAIETAGPDVQKEEADFLIGSVSDSLVRQHVAVSLYEHYLASEVMGAEAVAIHILDNWFFNGKVKMPDEVSLINARVFAEFNRQSLIGARAPVLTVEDMTGRQVGLFEGQSDRYSILYFYDAGCATCKVESALLKRLLDDEDYPVDLYAFYAGDDKEAWTKYVAEHLSLSSESVNAVHVWDPQVDSDFHRKYGVLQTPRMFLIRPDGRIMGRGLDVRALARLLNIVFSDVKLDYGSSESAGFYSKIFSGGSPSEEQVRDVADMIAGSTLCKGDTVMFRQMAGDMLYYLSSERGSGYKEGLAYLIDTYILDPSLKVWRTPDDSLKVVGYAGIMDELLSKAAPGNRIADLKVPGLLVAGSRKMEKNMNLRKLRGKENIIIFHTEGCNICKAEIQAAGNIAASDRNVKVFLVNVDDVLLRAPSLAARLFDAFDLSSLPFIVITNKKGIIHKRYATLQN